MEKQCCGDGERKRMRTPDEMRRLCNRLSRVEGQVRGIRQMLERDAYCPDILNQVAAAGSALDAFGRELLSEHVRTCVARDLREGREDTVDELMRTMERMMR